MIANNPNLLDWKGKHMRHGVVYMYRNKINGKSYIGQTTQPIYRRRREHWSDAFRKNSQRPFHRALRKYGKSAFDEIILCSSLDKEALDSAEQHMIKLYSSNTAGYNLSNGGSANGMHSELTKQKISLSSKKAWQGNDYRQKVMKAILTNKNWINLNTKKSHIKSGETRRGKLNIGQENLKLGAISSRKPVKRIDPETKNYITFESGRSAAIATPGATPSGISDVCKGKYSIHVNYLWEYA